MLATVQFKTFLSSRLLCKNVQNSNIQNCNFACGLFMDVELGFLHETKKEE
jgi:hypothetical protein